jgi:D-glycero-beta-D-manno-heptose-7-phosphate kinase
LPPIAESFPDHAVLSPVHLTLLVPRFLGILTKNQASREGTNLVTFTRSRLQTLLGNLSGKQVAVVGDLMLDRYYWGSVARISPEAPVPVVEVDSESTRLGGAANVANNIASLGGTPLMIGVTGDDEAGRSLRSIVTENKFPVEGLLVDSSRPTTVKTRVIADLQHVVRVDREVKHEISEDIQGMVLDVLRRNIKSLDAIIIEDYNKGVIVKSLIHEIIDIAKRNGLIITVDPKFSNFFEYKRVTVFKPNRKETEEALGIRLHDQGSVDQAAKTLVDRLDAENVLLTLGEQGMTLVERGGAAVHVPTMARKVADVSGAGDTVISTLTMALAAGASVREASMLANFAGGIVCGEVGIVPIDVKLLSETVLESMNHPGDV